MALFEDEIEQAGELFRSYSERIKESSLFNNLSEKFNSLSPSFQKFLGAICIAFLIFLVLGLPISKYQSSMEYLDEFQTRKNITQKMIILSKSTSSKKKIPKKYSLGELKSEVERLNTSRVINILPEQSLITNDYSELKPSLKSEHQMFNIKSSKLNIKQATSLIYSIKKLNKSLSIEGINLTLSPLNPDYFDTSIKVANFFLTPIEEILPKAEVPKQKKKKRKKRGGRR